MQTSAIRIALVTKGIGFEIARQVGKAGTRSRCSTMPASTAVWRARIDPPRRGAAGNRAARGGHGNGLGGGPALP
jgi:hypothetical protein